VASQFLLAIFLIYIYVPKAGEHRLPLQASVVRVPHPRAGAKKALDLSSGWDGWPDGTFERLFCFEEVDLYNNLLVHWATRSHGVRGGNEFAEEWVEGKRLRRDCLGIIECDNPDCTFSIRPQTTPKAID
jgi:hypothetical protein